MPDPYWCDTYNNGQGKGLGWSLEISSPQTEVDDDFWAPFITIERAGFPARDWRALEGQDYVWNSPVDEATGEANGTLYVFEHADISKAHLHFGRREGLKYHVRLTGLCDVHYDDTYGADVALSVSATVEFSSIVVAGSERDTAETLRARLSEHVNIDDFEQGELLVNEHTYDSGVGMTSCEFTPRL